ncbi:MAG: HDIG domain-containing protein [Phycisphaerales bacterium]
MRKTLAAERASRMRRLVDAEIINSCLLWLLFVVFCVFILAFEFNRQVTYLQTISIAVIVIIISVAAAFYIHHYQRRIIRNHARAIAIAILFIFLLAAVKVGTALTDHTCWATGAATTAAIILAIAYDQRFAVGISIIFCLLAAFATSPQPDLRTFLVMATTAFTCCLSLKEIRTRIKLLQVGALTAVIVFVSSLFLDLLAADVKPMTAISNGGWHGFAAFSVSVIIQGLLPLIERAFRIATSMTLLDFSDANQPLLKRLAMEAPGTFSHSLLVGSIAEAAAEAIGRNGLLCRVGAYYHDVGKINKPAYFVENQVGSTSKHKELSPAMSQLIIEGHVKDGKEMAREYHLPAVLRQFIETHHGTTLVEYFYNEAKKKQDDKQPPPSESEFRYEGPKPRTKEAAIVMLADAVESAVRSLQEVTPAKIDAVVHNMALKRLQDGQFDECDMTLRELSRIEVSMAKTLTAHYHSRITYPEQDEQMETSEQQPQQVQQREE